MQHDFMSKTTLFLLLLILPTVSSAQFGSGFPRDNAAQAKYAPIRSVADLFDKLPPDLRPAKDGWNAAALAKVEDWIKQNLVGKRVEATVTLTNVEVEKSKHFEPEHAWRVAAHMKTYLKPGTVGALRFESPVAGKDGQEAGVDFLTDEETARKWQRKREKIRDEFIRTQRPPASADGSAAGVFQSFQISRETLKDPSGTSSEGYRVQIGLDGLELTFKDLPTKPTAPPAKKP